MGIRPLLAALVALGQTLGDGGRETLAALGVPLLVPGRAPAARSPVAHDLAAIRAGPPEHAQLPAEVGRSLRRFSQAASARLLPRCRASSATPRASPTCAHDMPPPGPAG
jgi:hypothetical protein